MRAKSISGRSPDELRSGLREAVLDGFEPTLGIVFISVTQNSAAVCDLLEKAGIDVVGASSCSEFTDTSQTDGGIAALLLEIDPAAFTILFEEVGTRTLEETGHQLAAAAAKRFANPSMIILSTSLMESGLMLDGEKLIRSIETTAGANVNLFGGMAGDDMSFSGTFVFTGKGRSDHGVAAVVFDEDKIKMHGVALSGWKSIGLSRLITKSRNNLLYEIDGKPALQTYLRFLGEDLDAVEDPSKFFDGIGLHYPLQIERAEREPMMCNPMGYNKDENALIMESNIEEGASFRFSTPPDFDIVETVLDKAKAIRGECNEDADAVLIFSCASRLSALGPMAQKENEGLAELWKAPMAGFYTYGEFGRAVNGKHEFHSTTCSWVALKEQRNPQG